MQEREVDCIVMQPPALGGNDIRHQRRGERSREGGGGGWGGGGAECHSKYITDAPCAAKNPQRVGGSFVAAVRPARRSPASVISQGTVLSGSGPQPPPPCPSPAPSLKQRWWQETQLGPPLSLTLNGGKGLGKFRVAGRAFSGRLSFRSVHVRPGEGHLAQRGCTGVGTLSVFLVHVK